MLLLKFPFCDRLSVFFSNVFFGTKNNHALYFSTKGRELYYFLSYFWSLIAVFANEVRAHEVLVVFFIHRLTKTVSLFLPGDKIIKDGQPAMQNAITTKIFKDPVCWCLKRFLNQPSCNESIFYYFQTFLQNVLRESGFGTKGKFNFYAGLKVSSPWRKYEFSRFFFHLLTRHSFQRFFMPRTTLKLTPFSK